MLIAEENIVVINASGRDVHCTVTMPLSKGQHSVVFLLHGFKGFRNWGFFPFAAQHLAAENFIAIRIDTSLNGMRGTNNEVISLEDFASNTISAEVNDVHNVVSALLNNKEFEDVRKMWNGSVCIVGHSRGGAIAHIVAHELLNAKGLFLGKCVVWNSVGNAKRWTERQVEVWRSLGTFNVENTRTGQMLQMNYSFYEDLVANEERFSLLSSALSLQDRMLYVHAEMDATVSLNEIKQLISKSGSNAVLEVISGSTHTFGITHPIERITNAFVKVINITTEHLRV